MWQNLKVGDLAVVRTMHELQQEFGGTTSAETNERFVPGMSRYSGQLVRIVGFSGDHKEYGRSCRIEFLDKAFCGGERAYSWDTAMLRRFVSRYPTNARVAKQ